jgi:hypothetical protein
MLKKCSPFIFVLLALCATTPDALGQDKAERVKGVVIAYPQGIFSSACPWWICGGDRVLLRVEGVGWHKPAYARVEIPTHLLAKNISEDITKRRRVLPFSRS